MGLLTLLGLDICSTLAACRSVTNVSSVALVSMCFTLAHAPYSSHTVFIYARVWPFGASVKEVL